MENNFKEFKSEVREIILQNIKGDYNIESLIKAKDEIINKYGECIDLDILHNICGFTMLDSINFNDYSNLSYIDIEEDILNKLIEIGEYVFKTKNALVNSAIMYSLRRDYIERQCKIIS